MVSDAVAGAPRYRLTYRFTESNEVRIRFAIAPPGQPEAFRQYLEGTAQRVRN